MPVINVVRDEQSCYTHETRIGCYQKRGESTGKFKIPGEEQVKLKIKKDLWLII